MRATRNLSRITVVLVLVSALVWSWQGMSFDATRLRSGLGFGAEYVRQMFPPDWSELPEAWEALKVTVQMAILGTFIGLVFALPIGFLAARTSALPRPISATIKTVLNVLRAIPSLIYAILFVYIVGLGPFPGALGIAIGSFVMLSKLFAETLESVHPAPIEAVKAAGGTPSQVFVYGMLPQALPQFLSHTLYAWELNISAATVVGIVGAGGIGFKLKAQMGYFAWQKVSVYIMLLVGMVLLADLLSFQFRRRFT